MKASLKSWLFIGLSLFFCSTTIAQNTAIQTLTLHLQNTEITSDSAAHICRQITRLYAGQRQHSRALEYAQKEALLLQKKATSSIKIAEVFFNMASLHRALANYPQSILHAEKALEIYRSSLGETHLETLHLYKFLAQNYYLKNDFKQVLKLANKAYEGYSKLSSKQPKAEIDVLILIGSVSLKSAQFNTAQAQFLKALAIYQNFQTNLHEELLARIYNNLASLKIEQQATLEALGYYQKIVEIRSKLQHEHHYTLQKTYTNIGLCYFKLNDFDRALVYHRKSLAISYQNYTEQHDMVAFCHNHIGGTFHRLGQADSAKYHLLKAVKIYRSVFGNSSPQSIAPLWRLAKMFRVQGDYLKSKVSLEKSMLIQQIHFGQHHPDLAKMYLDMAYLYEDQKQYAKAIFHANKAYQANLLHQHPIDKPLMLGIIEAQLEISLHLPHSEKTKAYLLLDKIQPNVALAQANLHYQTDQQNLIHGLREVCEAGIELCYKLYQQQANSDYLEKAFQLIEYNKAVLLSIQIKQAYWAGQSEKNPTNNQAEVLLGEIHFLEQEWKRAEFEGDSAKAQTLQQELFEKYQIIEQQVDSLSVQLQYHSPIKLVDLQKQLNADQLVLHYFYGTQHLYILSIRADAVYLTQTSLDFEEDLAAFSELLLNLEQSKIRLKASCQQLDQIAHLLYQHFIPFTAHQMLFIPDHQLNYLPFEALTKKKNKTAQGYHQLNYLLHQHRISYAYSATSYYYQQFKHLNQRDAQIFALAPDYTQHKNLAPLKANQSEVQFLEQHFAGLFCYNKKATKGIFQAQSGNYGILHLASHAYADNHELQQAQLFFSKHPTDSLASILQPHEIAQLPLKTDLVVLSACQTAIGYWQKGEGIMSLARDFMYAGAPSILTTLWQINDQSSSLIVQHFYTNLQSMDKDKALQLAKQSYLQEASAFAAHPYFWSGFVLLGNTNRLDLDVAASTNLYYLVGFFLIIVLITFLFIRNYRKS